MIQIHNNILNSNECNEFINFYNNNVNNKIDVNSDNIYHFDYVNLINNLGDFNFFKRINLTNNIVDRIRVQHIDKETNILEKFHCDYQAYSFIVFLNDDFEGGELIYRNLNITPIKGQLIYHDGITEHYVKKIKNGNRFTLVCFLKKYIDFNKNII